MVTPKFLISKEGFTLIELLITIAILAILMAMVVVILNPIGQFKDARDSNRKQMISRISEAMEACFTLTGGAYASCDSITDLIAGEYLESTIATEIDGDTQTWTCTVGASATTLCIAVDLERDTFYKYDRTVSGKSVIAATACAAGGGTGSTTDCTP